MYLKNRLQGNCDNILTKVKRGRLIIPCLFNYIIGGGGGGKALYIVPLQFFWENDAINSFTECLKSPQSQQKLERLINHDIPTSKDGVNT
jgi:hypothetical protein